MTCANGLTYVSDMKIGHYMKVPPRSMFAAQAFAVVWLSLVQIATYNFVIGNINKVCEEDQPQGLICPNAQTFYNASVIWGVIVSSFHGITGNLTHVLIALYRVPSVSLVPVAFTPGPTGSGLLVLRAQPSSTLSPSATLGLSPATSFGPPSSVLAVLFLPPLSTTFFLGSSLVSSSTASSDDTTSAGGVSLYSHFYIFEQRMLIIRHSPVQLRPLWCSRYRLASLRCPGRSRPWSQRQELP